MHYKNIKTTKNRFFIQVHWAVVWCAVRAIVQEDNLVNFHFSKIFFPV